MTISREERVRAIKDAFHYLTWVAMRQLTQVLQPFGLTPPQYFVLAVLAAHRQACPMRDLISVTIGDPPTMTGVIDRLVKMKLVERTRIETDRRLVMVQATPSGIDLATEIHNQIVQDATGYADLNDDELADLERVLIHKLSLFTKRYKSLQDTEFDAEMEKFRHFIHDPIHYAKLENNRNS
jgi:MarR family transcriptional regulator, organic hydroperoxide resistance regulator